MRKENITRREISTIRDMIDIVTGKKRNTKEAIYNPLVAQEVIKTQSLRWLSLLLRKIEQLAQKDGEK